MERFLLGKSGVIIRDKIARRDLAFRIIFHMENNGATRFGVTANS